MERFFSFVPAQCPAVPLYAGFLSRAVRRSEVINANIAMEVRTVVIDRAYAIATTVRGLFAAMRYVRYVLVNGYV